MVAVEAGHLFGHRQAGIGHHIRIPALQSAVIGLPGIADGVLQFHIQPRKAFRDTVGHGRLGRLIRRIQQQIDRLRRGHRQNRLHIAPAGKKRSSAQQVPRTHGIPRLLGAGRIRLQSGSRSRHACGLLAGRTGVDAPGKECSTIHKRLLNRYSCVCEAVRV